ncbi:replicative DNA helicase [Kitasatospora sp. NPDC059327]|uniref:replicative DNA helicase n=1 Tax=Kitasatospora sp. NPDC059327 TaxID=3346803 RepID=UPI0036AF3E4D
MTIPQQHTDLDDAPAPEDLEVPDDPFEDQEPSTRKRPRGNRTKRPAGDQVDGLGDIERVPPNDLAAERATLGGMMLSKDAIGDVIGVLQPGDYYRPAHKLIHDAILALFAKGEPADAITVAGELTRRGELVRAGGPGYLHDCANIAVGASSEYYAGIVHERAVFRRLSESGTRIANLGFVGEGDVHEVVDAAQSELFGVLGRDTSTEIRPLGATADSLADRIEARKNAKGGLQGVSTGFRDLDTLTGGLRPGQFVIVAARPAIGKSTLAVDFARACSIENKIPSALFSLEMGREEIEERIMSAHARISHQHMKTGDMTDDDWSRFARYYDDYANAPLFIDDSEHLTVMDVAAKARRLKQQHDIGLIVIDYIQLMKSGTRNPESRQQEVSDISRNLKLLAKQLRVPVVGLSQLNRGPEQRTDKRPMVSDLRESGSLEQDADIVILLHREDAYEKESPRAGEADLIVAKHRGGPTATITVGFQGHYSRFVDMVREDKLDR